VPQATQRTSLFSVFVDPPRELGEELASRVPLSADETLLNNSRYGLRREYTSRNNKANSAPMIRYFNTSSKMQAFDRMIGCSFQVQVSTAGDFGKPQEST
jgi:hypothetical protein